MFSGSLNSFKLHKHDILLSFMEMPKPSSSGVWTEYELPYVSVIDTRWFMLFHVPVGHILIYNFHV